MPGAVYDLAVFEVLDGYAQRLIGGVKLNVALVKTYLEGDLGNLCNVVLPGKVYCEILAGIDV